MSIQCSACLFSLGDDISTFNHHMYLSGLTCDIISYDDESEADYELLASSNELYANLALSGSGGAGIWRAAPDDFLDDIIFWEFDLMDSEMTGSIVEYSFTVGNAASITVELQHRKISNQWIQLTEVSLNIIDY